MQAKLTGSKQTLFQTVFKVYWSVQCIVNTHLKYINFKLKTVTHFLVVDYN